MTNAPADHAWWLASRAAGITALLAITVAVGVGLALGGKAARRPGWPRVLLAIHEHAALAGLIATAAHGVLLLGDGFLRPSLADIAIPFASTHEPAYTGLGVIAGYLGAILGLSFYARKRIGMKRWRTLHKATILVYVLSVSHTLGAGTDASQPWMHLLLLTTGVPILFLFVLRLLPRDLGALPRVDRPAPRSTPS